MTHEANVGSPKRMANEKLTDSSGPATMRMGRADDDTVTDLPAVERHRLNAETAIANMQHERAAFELGCAIRLEPSRPDIFARRGDVWRALGRADQAVADYTESLDLDSQQTDIWLARGQVLLMAGRAQEAAADFSRVLAENPQTIAAYHGRGQARWQMGDAGQAKADFSRVIELVAEPSEAYLERGSILLAEGEFEAAIVDLSTAARLNPFLWLALARRAQAYSKLGRHDCATADLTSALRLDPKNTVLLADKAEALLRLGMLDAAFENYTQAIEINPRNPRLLARRGGAYLACGQYDLAAADLTAALAIEPEHREWLCMRGKARLLDGQPETALADFTEAVRIAPSHLPAHFGRAQVYLSQRNYDAAATCFDRVIECKPDGADGYYERARCHFAMSRLAAARADADRAIQLDPSAIDPRRLRIDTLLRGLQLDDADREIAALSRIAPNHHVVFYLRGKLSYRRGQLDAALDELTRAVQLDPSFGDSRGARGGVLRALGHHTESLTDLALAVQADPRYIAEYLVQRGILSGTQGDYDWALADLIAALHVEPANPSALRARERILNKRDTQAPVKVVSARATPKAPSGPNSSAAVSTKPPRPTAHIPIAPVVAKAPPAPAATETKLESDLEESIDFDITTAPPTDSEPEISLDDFDLTAETDAGSSSDDELTLSVNDHAESAPSASATVASVVTTRTVPAPSFNPRQFDPPKPATRFQTSPPRRSTTSDSDSGTGARKIGKIALVLIAILVVGGIVYRVDFAGGPSKPAGSEGKAAIQMTADRFWDMFQADNREASGWFDNCYVEVTGTVKEVITDSGRNAIVLQTQSDRYGIECQFGSKDELKNAKVGDQVAIGGTGTARNNPRANVVIVKCQILKQ